MKGDILFITFTIDKGDGVTYKEVIKVKEDTE